MGMQQPGARGRSTGTTPSRVSTAPGNRVGCSLGPSRGGEGLHAPQEELDVDHGRRDLLHHVGDEVELVPRAGQLVEACSGGRGRCSAQGSRPGSRPEPPRVGKKAAPPRPPPGTLSRTATRRRWGTGCAPQRMVNAELPHVPSLDPAGPAGRFREVGTLRAAQAGCGPVPRAVPLPQCPGNRLRPSPALALPCRDRTRTESPRTTAPELTPAATVWPILGWVPICV